MGNQCLAKTRNSKNMASSKRGAKSKPLFLVKGILCLLCFVFFLIGGTLLCIADTAFIKPLEEPFKKLRRISVAGLVICGIILLLASLVSMLSAIAYFLILPRDTGVTRMGKEEAKEIGMIEKKPASASSGSPKSVKSEITPAAPPPEVSSKTKKESKSEDEGEDEDEGEFYPEKLYMKQTETILQVIPDPLAKWDGTGLYPLLETMHVDEQGELKFPPRAPLDDTQIQK